MADIYIYADETGNMDYGAADKQGASRYFGFGTVVFDRPHEGRLWDGMALRVRLAAGEDGLSGLNLPRGFHAKDDRNTTRAAMFHELRKQAPRYDATFLFKANAYSDVRARGDMYLYKLTWFLHLKCWPNTYPPRGIASWWSLRRSGRKPVRQKREQRLTTCVSRQAGLTSCVYGTPPRRGVYSWLTTPSGQTSDTWRGAVALGTASMWSRSQKVASSRGRAASRRPAIPRTRRHPLDVLSLAYVESSTPRWEYRTPVRVTAVVPTCNRTDCLGGS